MEAQTGFIGLGVMGTPMAANLLKAGTPLVVWNRTPEKVEGFRSQGASVAATVTGVFERAETVILMLFDRAAIDAVLQRGTVQFGAMVRDRTIVNMSSIAPNDSRDLDRDIRAAGGRYVEAPVSGSRVPAEQGRLVAMLAGEPDLARALHPLLARMCHTQVFCGAIGSALQMKLAVNVFMLVTANGLAEAVHFADRSGLRREDLAAVLNAGPMASDFSRTKLMKVLGDDYSAQATIADALNSTRLIGAAAEQVGASCDLIGVCRSRFEDVVAQGHGAADLIAVHRAIGAR